MPQFPLGVIRPCRVEWAVLHAAGKGGGPVMYVLSVLLLTLVFPSASVWFDLQQHPGAAALPALIAQWFVFWAAGARLFLAGLRQLAQPRFTSRDIFGIASDDALPIVRELGVANLATGTVGLLSHWRHDFVLPVALVAAIFYGLAGIRHLFQPHRTFNENVALVSDLFLGALFALWIGLTVAANFGIDVVL
jgi:hypothetical protein